MEQLSRRALSRSDDLVDEDPWYVSLGHTTEDRARVYANWLEASISDEEWELIRRATQQGRVVGSAVFQEDIGSRVGRRLKGETAGTSKTG